MANEGIFITKNGVTLPSGTEVSTSNWAAYQADLVLPVIQDTDHEFNVFEGFKYRGFITDNVHARFTFNAKTNYTPSFVSGAGSLNTGNGEISPSSVPLTVEEANKVFLVNSQFKAEQLADGDDIGVRIASIDALSRILLNIDTKLLTFHKANVLTTSESETYTEPETIVIDILDDAITFSVDGAGIPLYSLPRSFTAKVLTGSVGVLNSSGTATGDALPFDQTDTLEAADITGNGTMSIESSFGQITTYTVKLGESLTTGGLYGPSAPAEIEFTAGQAGAHNVTDEFSGGIGAKSYAINSGALPSGMVLTSGGVIQGTPVTDGTYNVSVGISDEYGDEVGVEYIVTVTPTANVNYNPPSAVEGVPYEYNPKISGITGATVASGSLPTGLSLNADTGILSGTPSANGSFSFSLELTLDDSSETVDVVIVVYNLATAEVFKNGDSAGLVVTGGTVEVNQTDDVNVAIDEGSGQYQYSITGGNLIDSEGNIELFDTGSVTVTVTDLVTGQSIIIILLVAGQGDMAGMAVEEDDNVSSSVAPSTDIITDCNTPVNVAFNSLHILKGIDPTDVPYREYPNFESLEGASAQNNAKPFVMFRSTANNGYGIADNARDGKNFIVQFVLDATVANAITDTAIGIAKKFTNFALSGLEFACVITTVGSDRKVEIRKDNVYQTGSRFDIAEGQEVGFGVFANEISLFVDGILKYTLTSNTFSCSGVDLIFFAETSNMIVGGKAGNLIYDILTSGSADEVGVIDAQSGLYTPSLNNVALVRIQATSSVNGDVLYNAQIRVIRGAAKASLEHAMIEGIPVDVYIARSTRKDELPMRLDREGKPDKNQFTEPEHLGTLQGSGKMDVTPTRQDFNNDRGATSTSLRFDKVVFSGGFLNVRDIPVVKRLVPYMKEFNSHGVRSLKQYSTGCHERVRVIMVWQTAECDDVPIFDAIEIPNGLSYTMFNLEVGQGVQSQLPISIEGFPDKDGVLFEYSQFDRHFNRIAG